MANELTAFVPVSTMAVYGVLVRESDGQWWNNTGSTWEAPDTNARTQYAISLTGVSSVRKRGNMPAVTAGLYSCLVYRGDSASAAATDIPAGQMGPAYWSGSAFVVAETTTAKEETLLEAIPGGGGDYRYKTAALTQAPTGSGGGAAEASFITVPLVIEIDAEPTVSMTIEEI